MISLIGYLASGLLAVALLVERALWFRWINLAGNVTFVAYGLLMGALPVALANGILLGINVFKLVSLSTRQEHFELARVRQGDEIVASFLRFHRKDVHSYFPDFRFDSDEGRICFMVLRDAKLANLFVARREGGGRVIVEINYTVPKFRDYKVGTFLFEVNSDYLRAQGVTEIVTRSHNSGHTRFLERMGFARIERDGEALYEKRLAPAA